MTVVSGFFYKKRLYTLFTSRYIDIKIVFLIFRNSGDSLNRKALICSLKLIPLPFYL